MTLPEEKLLSAVIVQALEDVCLKPTKDANRKYRLVHNARTAYEFLFVNSNIYLELLNIDTDAFRRKILTQLYDMSTNRPFDLSKRDNPIINRRKRCFQRNHKIYQEEMRRI
jgi:hypothetical protein